MWPLDSLEATRKAAQDDDHKPSGDGRETEWRQIVNTDVPDVLPDEFHVSTQTLWCLQDLAPAPLGPRRKEEK